jgi:hypothetical protein
VGVVVSLGQLRETFEAPVTPSAGAFGFFAPTVSDDKGRFLIRGLGKEKVTLDVRDERFAHQQVSAQPVISGDTKAATFSLAEARVVQGRVTHGDTGTPAVGARVFADSDVEGLTDHDGRYSLIPGTGDKLVLRVFPADGEPYLMTKEVLSWGQSRRLDANLTVKRGVLVRGTIRERPTDRPVAGAVVAYRPLWRNNPFNDGKYNYTAYNYNWFQQAPETAVSDADGTFRIAVPPGPGHLFILGPTLDYVHVESSIGALEFGRPSRVRVYPDALVPLDLKPDAEPQNVSATLRRGVTLKARVEGFDGTSVNHFLVVSRPYIPTGFEHYQMFWNELQGRDGYFELPGCDPEKGTTAWILDAEHELGATLNLTGAEVAGPTRTVRLERCGAVKIRCINSKGKPVANHLPWVCIVMSPGTIFSASALSKNDDKELEGDWGFWGNYHFRREWTPQTDGDGRTTFRALIPGATYAHVGLNAGFAKTGPPKVEFHAKPGETVTLPDFVVTR